MLTGRESIQRDHHSAIYSPYRISEFFLLLAAKKVTMQLALFCGFSAESCEIRNSFARSFAVLFVGDAVLTFDARESKEALARCVSR